MLNRKEYEENLAKAREKQIEQISEYLAGYIKLNAKTRDLPLVSNPDEDILKSLENIPIPQKGRDPKEIGDELIEKVFEQSLMIQHPKFFSFVTSAVSPYSLAGSILSDIYNVNTCGYELSPGASIIEQKLIGWMGSRIGYGENCGGVFTSGGSLSNLTGCIAARDNMLKEEEYPIGTAYISDQAHSSVRKGLHLMGLRRDQIRILPSDDNYKLPTDILEKEIEKDILSGKKPFLIVGSLGTTNTGSIDDFEALAKIRDKYGMWMHVDGAFGGSILFSDIYKNYAKGIEYSDSMSWDTHKWAMQVYSCSCIIAKDKKKLVKVFAEHPEYLADIINDEHTDGWDLGIEMSRPARCIKLWFTVQAMGTDLLSDVIDYTFFLMNTAKHQLEKEEDVEFTSTPMCGTLTFRFTPKEIPKEMYDKFNQEIAKTVTERRYAYIVTTLLKGKRVLRLNIINPNTTDEDIIDTVERLRKIAKELKNEFICKD